MENFEYGANCWHLVIMKHVRKEKERLYYAIKKITYIKDYKKWNYLYREIVSLGLGPINLGL